MSQRCDTPGSGLEILEDLERMMDNNALAHEVESHLRDKLPELRAALSERGEPYVGMIHQDGTTEMVSVPSAIDATALMEVRGYLEQLRHRADVRGGPDTSAMHMAAVAMAIIDELLADSSATASNPVTLEEIGKNALRILVPSEALKMAEQWKGRADDAGRLSRAVLDGK